MSKESGKTFKEKIISWLISCIFYGFTGLMYAFVVCFIGSIIWEAVGFEKWVFPKTYWSKEVKNIEASIRTKEAFLALDIKKLNSQKTNSTKNQDFDEVIETLIAFYKAQGKSEEEINKMILIKKEERKNIEAQVNLFFADAEQKAIDKKQKEIATEKQKLEFAKNQLIKYQGK